jgi:hypothetical protein
MSAKVEELASKIARDIRIEQSDDRAWDCLHNDRSIEKIVSDALTPALAAASQRGYAACTADAVAWCRGLKTRPYSDTIAEGLENGSHVGAAKAADGEEG